MSIFYITHYITLQLFHKKRRTGLLLIYSRTSSSFLSRKIFNSHFLYQMFINHNFLFHSIIVSIYHLFSNKYRIRIMYNTIMIRTNNHLIIRIIIQTINKIINMMCLRYVRTIFLTGYLTAYLATVSI